jgi:hypothetical protein
MSRVVAHRVEIGASDFPPLCGAMRTSAMVPYAGDGPYRLNPAFLRMSVVGGGPDLFEGAVKSTRMT